VINDVGPNNVIAVPCAESLSSCSAGFLRSAPGGAQGAHVGRMSADRSAKETEVLEQPVPIP
jgi:hypothetical protein